MIVKKKRIIKECEALIRVREYETIKFKSSGEWVIEFSSEEERVEDEKQCWAELVDDLKSAMTEWSGKIRHGGTQAADDFLENSLGAVSAKVEKTTEK